MNTSQFVRIKTLKKDRIRFVVIAIVTQNTQSSRSNVLALITMEFRALNLGVNPDRFTCGNIQALYELNLLGKGMNAK